MKEIKAFIHRNRAADVIRALVGAGFDQLSVVDVKGTLAAMETGEWEYSMLIGRQVITEIKLEVVCPAERVHEAQRLIAECARTGRSGAGWIYVSDLTGALEIR